MALFIGIDSGTQSTKAVVLDLEKGIVVAESRAPHELISGLPPGAMEQHPQDWIDAMETTIGEVLSKVDRDRVRGIGVSGQQHGFVPLDAEGRVLRPAKLWCDTSTAPECAWLTEALGGPEAVLKKLGNAFLPGFTAPKILWLKRHEPENFARLRHVLLPHDFLNHHLTGEYFMEYGDASGTALMDVRKRVWSAEAIEAIDAGLADWLPALSHPADPAGRVRGALAEKWGLGKDVLVSAGGGDNMMGAIGTGNVAPGRVTASFGTSGTIYAYSREPVLDPKGEIAAFCDSTGGWLPLLCTMNVTGVTELLRNLFGRDHADVEKRVAEAPPGCGGLLLLPYLEGERTPNVPDGTGVYFGLNRGTVQEPHLLRATMEGVTLGMNYGLRRLAELGVKPETILLTGGGARSAGWRQIMADCFGVPVVGMAEDEGAALGGALQAAWCQGRQSAADLCLADLTDKVVKVKEETRCEPDAERHQHYRRLQDLQDELGRALRPVFRKHRALISG
ncbi:MAG: xylulokinase [Puniceicoccaceae bacterium]|nr:MAG: xylulokinase [Puniceicoccaceae bacterium]